MSTFFTPKHHLIILSILFLFTIISGALGASCACIQDDKDQFHALIVLTVLNVLTAIGMVLGYKLDKKDMKGHKTGWYILYALAISFGIVISSMALACAVPCKEDNENKRKATEGIASFTLTASVILGAIGLYLVVSRTIDMSGGFGASLTTWKMMKNDVTNLTGFPVP